MVEMIIQTLGRSSSMAWRLAAALLLAALPAAADPQSETAPPEEQIAAATKPAGEEANAGKEPSVKHPPESVDWNLADAASRSAGLFSWGPVSLIDPYWKKLNRELDKIGLNVGLAYTAVYQSATGSDGTRDTAGGDVDLFGNWRLLGGEHHANRGLVYFAAEQRHAIFTDIAPGSLDNEIGSLWGTTNGFGEQHLALKELYWRQHLGGESLLLSAGKIDAENFYNSNYWQSDSKAFMNQAFSSFPVRAFPGNGLGLNATANLAEWLYISTGFQDAQGVKTEAGFDTFFDDFNLFSAFEVGFRPKLADLGPGTYRFAAWYREAGDSNGVPHDKGFDVSIDQRIGPRLVPFFRYGVGDGNIQGIEQMISAGTGWEGDLITKSDVVGIGASWGEPADGSLDDQYAAEIFYRLQVSPANQLTLGYQLIIDPALDPNDEKVGVYEVRWRIAF